MKKIIIAAIVLLMLTGCVEPSAPVTTTPSDTKQGFEAWHELFGGTWEEFSNLHTND